MSEMSAAAHAANTYAEALKSLRRFYQAEREYDAIVSDVAKKMFSKNFDELTLTQKRTVKHAASTEELLKEAAGKCLYARDRAHMLAAVYAMERDWQDREEFQAVRRLAGRPWNA